VIFVRVPPSWLITPDSDQTIFQWFDEYQKRFDRAGVVEIVSLSQTRSIWSEEAATYTPRADAWLTILERRTAAQRGDSGRR
jgi:hypothetical protein